MQIDNDLPELRRIIANDIDNYTQFNMDNFVNYCHQNPEMLSRIEEIVLEECEAHRARIPHYNEDEYDLRDNISIILEEYDGWVLTLVLQRNYNMRQVPYSGVGIVLDLEDD